MHSQDWYFWVGAFKPELKYSHDEEFADDKVFTIVSLESDRPEFREDLKRLKVKVLYYEERRPCHHAYFVNLNESHIPKLAELWWIKYIGRDVEPVTNTTNE